MHYIIICNTICMLGRLSIYRQHSTEQKDFPKASCPSLACLALAKSASTSIRCSGFFVQWSLSSFSVVKYLRGGSSGSIEGTYISNGIKYIPFPCALANVMAMANGR